MPCRSLKDASENVGITESSGRTYLARIFAKTGTHRQAELVALLSDSASFEPERGADNMQTCVVVMPAKRPC